MLQRILFSLVIFLLSSYLPVQAQTPGSAINPYEHGVKRFQKGDLDGAIEDFTKAISLSSRFGSNQLTRSSVPHSAKGLAPSAGEAREITVIDPLTAKAYTSRGAARYRNGDVDGAIADYELAIQINPGLAAAYVNRGSARYAKGDRDGALADWNRALRIDPRLYEAYNNRGVLRANLLDIDGALADFNQAIMLNPRFFEAYYDRGWMRRDKGDLEGAILERIKAEATQNSRVMDDVFFLTEVHGPRLTGSPGFTAAGDWVVKTLQAYGLENVRKEPLGPIRLGGNLQWSGRGWSFSRCAVHLLEPQQTPLLAVPAGWSQGTNGKVSGPTVIAPFPTLYDEDLEAYFTKFRGKLKGKIVLLSDQPRPIEPQSTAPFERYSEEELGNIARAPEPPPNVPAQTGPTPNTRPRLSLQQQLSAWNKLFAFLKSEGVLALVEPARGQGGTIFTRDQLGPPDPSPDPPPTVSLAPEHYNRLVRLMQRNVPVKLEIELDVSFHQNQDPFNVLADLPGTSRRDEVVMIGAHLDSWFGATGATDNAAGVAIVMEAMRILKALDLKMDRTVRVALWGAEEFNSAGSKAYVAKHLLDSATGERKPLHEKLSLYLNVDEGAGKIRGIYLQGNLKAKPMFESWIRPLKDLGATTVSVRDSYGSDHIAFDGAGIPAFAVIQDPLNYYSRTHHSNMDSYDYVSSEDLKLSAAIMAALIYQAAVHPEMVPRKATPPSPR